MKLMPGGRKDKSGKVIQDAALEYFEKPSLVEPVDLQAIPSVQDQVARMVAAEMARRGFGRVPEKEPTTGAPILEEFPEMEDMTEAEREAFLSDLELQARQKHARAKHEAQQAAQLKVAAEREAAAMPPPTGGAGVEPPK